ncbi:MAG TPA: hypothetical protein VLA36_03750 [Longimicrobiales bacterium]|nr:hypothetical protein [Longimicrobiales bacterium]
MSPSPLSWAALRRASRRVRRVGACLAIVFLVACGGARTRNPFDTSPEGQGILSLYLENRGFNDVRIYAITPAGSTSMGSVGGNTIRRATLPWRQLGQISFRIEVLAGRTYMTNTMLASPGDRLELVIPANPADAILRPRSVPR